MNVIAATFTASLLFFFGVASHLYAVRLDRTMPDEPYGRDVVSWQYDAIAAGLMFSGLMILAAIIFWL